ncbi:MAG: FAD-binding protein [Candidatus Obscuribacterales bacterium]|nr:FAD-binding protein [Candidatus Obscuribacterales bacterium]
MIELKLSSEFETALKQIVGDYYVLSSAVDLALYECDAETLDLASPDLVVLPGSTEEVSAVVRLCQRYAVPFTPRGAGTGLSGGATAVCGGVSLVLTRLTRIINIDPAEMVAHVQVGVTNISVSQSAKHYGLNFAPDPSSQAASTIGGNIAENAGGAHTLKYGMTGNNVVGMKMVLPDGEIVTVGGAYRDSLSLDLLGVIVGSEGTLGVVTEAYLRLTPNAEQVETMLAYFPDLESGGQAVSDIIAAGIIPCAMEMIDALSLGCVEQSLHLGLNLSAGALLIVELDGPKAGIDIICRKVEAIAKANNLLEVHWAEDASSRASIWKARKSAFASLGRIAPHGYVLDGVIPRSKLREAIIAIAEIGKKYRLPISNIYHAGDGNLHPALLYDREREAEVQAVLRAAKEILELCVRLGGTLSGEHGIGVEKIQEMPLAFDQASLAAMTSLKNSFDPQLICNPGKVIPNLKHCGESGSRSLLRHQLSAC